MRAGTPSPRNSEGTVSAPTCTRIRLFPNIGDSGKGDVLQDGALVAIEPIFSMGTDPRITQRDGEFAYRTADGARAAHLNTQFW